MTCLSANASYVYSLNALCKWCHWSEWKQSVSWYTEEATQNDN